MPWYVELLTGTGIGGVIFGLSLASALGLALGSIRVKGVSLGVAGVLFAGIAVSYLMWSQNVFDRLVPYVAGSRVDASAARTFLAVDQDRRRVLEFLRELGLVLFVYSVGLEIGPGFFSALRTRGLRWNLVVVLLVVANVLVTLAAHRWLSVDPAAAIGILSGAVTNTPGLAAAEQALGDLPGVGAAHGNLADVGCAVAYPFGVVGAILSLPIARALLSRWPRRLTPAAPQDVPRERESALGGLDLRVANPAIAGQHVDQLAQLLGSPVVISRMMRSGSVELPGPRTELHLDDVVHAVGKEPDLERLAVLLGGRATVDVREAPGPLAMRELAVTRAAVVGRSLGQLDLNGRYHANITRLRRAGLEIVPSSALDLHYGDRVVVVGEANQLGQVERLVGNAVAELEHPQLVPVFIAIAMGVLLGLIPFSVPGLRAPVRLGLAGGPLVAALVVSHFGRIGRVSFFLPNGASFMLRSFGVVLFMGCVGLLSGERFVATMLHGPGLRWLALGAMITFVPLLVAEVAGGLFLERDVSALGGVIAGGMTSPPLLAFVTKRGRDVAAAAYGTVYPLAMFLRVVSAQALVVLWLGAPR